MVWKRRAEETSATLLKGSYSSHSLAGFMGIESPEGPITNNSKCYTYNGLLALVQTDLGSWTFCISSYHPVLPLRAREAKPCLH